MNIESYSDLLATARAQGTPQRLLFTFVRADLPADAGAAERSRYAAGQGGTLSPVMCVDRLPADLGSFADLVEESRQMGAHWDLVFVTSMSAGAGNAANEADLPLKKMVASIQDGQLDRFLAFNRDGELLHLH